MKRSILAAGLLAAALAHAQQDPAYVPPRGGYDTPGTFIKVLGNAGESYERALGEPQTNAYQRQVRLKLLGLETLSQLSTLKAEVNQSADDDEANKAKGSDGHGGMLGAIASKLNPLLAQEVDRQKEVAKDELAVQLIEAGSPADNGRGVLVDVVGPPNQVHGSIFGMKVNNKVKVAVTATDFNPRVLILRHRPKSKFSSLQGDASPEFTVVASTDTEGEGTNKVIATYDRLVKASDGSRGLYIAVTSEDGKAVTGKYTIKYYQ